MKNHFRFDFKGKDDHKDNTYLIIKYEPPLSAGEVSVALGHGESEAKRLDAVHNLSALALKLNKTVKLSRWNYHDAVMVETHVFDSGLGVLMSSRLETQGIVPGGSTERLKRQLREEGHELKEDNILLGDGAEKPGRLRRFFRTRKRGRER